MWPALRHTFDDTGVALLVEPGDRAATAVDNALLLQREQANRTRLEGLQRATAALSAAATPEQVARAAAEQFALLARARAVTLWRLTAGADGGDDGALEPVDLGAAVADVPGGAARIPLSDPAAPAVGRPHPGTGLGHPGRARGAGLHPADRRRHLRRRGRARGPPP